MPSVNLMKRVAKLATLSLEAGSHGSTEKKFCVMEAVAYIAGEPHSDHPQCASPVITRMLIAFNDRLKTNADRDRLLKPIIPLLVGTRTTDADEETRVYLALDWVARQRIPAWFRLCGLTAEAEVLEGLARVVDATTAGVARSALYTARDAAWTRRDQNYEALRAQLRTAQKPAAAAAAAAADAAYAAADAAYADAADAAYAADAAAAADAAYAAAYAAADAAYADAADAAAGPSSVHADALRAAADAYPNGGYAAARSAARAVYDEKLATDPTFEQLRKEAAASQESFIELVRDLCAVGRASSDATASANARGEEVLS